MRHDRHGRTAHADTDRRRRPSDGFRLRDRDRFERITEDAIGSLPDALLDALTDAELVVEEIPPSPRLTEYEVPLAEFRPRHARHRARITVYRRPVEARAQGRAELAEIVRLAVGREVAFTLGVEFDDDWD